jgi:hypothetical protein
MAGCLLLLVRELRRLIVPLTALALALLAGLAAPARGQPSDCWTGNPDASRTYYDCVTGAVLCTCPSWDTLCATAPCSGTTALSGGTGTSPGDSLTIRCGFSRTSLIADGQETTALTITVYDDSGIPVPGATVAVKPVRYVISRGQTLTDGLGSTSWIFGTIETGTNSMTITAASPGRGLSGSITKSVTGVAPHPSSVSIIEPPAGSTLPCLLPVLMGDQNGMFEKWSWNSARTGAGPYPYQQIVFLTGRNGTCYNFGPADSRSIQRTYTSDLQGGQQATPDNTCCWLNGSDLVFVQLFAGEWQTNAFTGAADYVYGGPFATSPVRYFTVTEPAQ